MKKTTLSKIFGVAVVIALLASLFVAAVPVGALSSITVTPDSTIISDSTTYTIKFSASTNLTYDTDTDDCDYVTITFPEDTDTTEVDESDVTFNGDPINEFTDNNALDAGILEFYVPDNATIGSKWTVIVADVINPSTSGSYTLTLATSQETDGETSTAYSIGNPESVEIYNASGNLVKSLDSLSEALTSNSLKNYYTIQLGEGEYDLAAADNATYYTLTKSYVTIESTGSAADTIIRGLIVTGTNTTLTNLTFEDYNSSNTVALTLSADAEAATISDCAFAKYKAGWASTLLKNSAPDLTVEDCTFDTSLGNARDTAISMAGTDAYADISGCTFTLDQTSGYKADYGVAINAAISSVGSTPAIVVSGSTFTGTGGIGFYDPTGADSAVITGDTFTGLESAAVIACDDAVTNIDANTITSSVFSTSQTYNAGVYISAAAKVTVTQNTFQDNLGYSVLVTGDADNVYVLGNSFINNTKGMANNDTTNDLLAPLNWWNSADGPTTADVAGGDTTIKSKGNILGATDTSTYTFLTVAPTNAAISLVDTDANSDGNYEASIKQKSGNYITISNYAGPDDTDWISGIKLSDMPTFAVTPDYPSIAYYDIFTTSASEDDLAVKLYATGLDDTTQAYYWSGSSGNWELCSNQSTAANGTYVTVTIKSADSGSSLDDTSPMASDLTGTAFVLVSGVAPASESFDVESPELGSTMGLTNIPFSWDALSGATSYAFVLSANADLSSPVTSQPNLSITAYNYTGTLTAGAYYWQATAYRNNEIIGKSVTGTFIAAAPVVAVATSAAAPITITSQAAPTITITQAAPTTITIPQPAVEQITPAWIWGIVGIGAILIIVVIVLIVRTRRSV